MTEAEDPKGRKERPFEKRGVSPPVMVKSVSQLLDKVLLGNPEMIYRGHSDDTWDLRPKLARTPQSERYIRYRVPNWLTAPDEVSQTLIEMETILIQKFRSRCVPYLEFQPDGDLEWLALAQHHGFSTRLLDWTTNPLVALFFACTGEAKTEGAIWSMPANDERSAIDYREVGEIHEVAIFRPRHLARRIVAQSGLFTFHPFPNQSYLPKHLTVYTIPLEVRRNVLKELRHLNMHEATLFPDLDGLTRYLMTADESEIRAPR